MVGDQGAVNLLPAGERRTGEDVLGDREQFEVARQVAGQPYPQAIVALAQAAGQVGVDLWQALAGLAEAGDMGADRCRRCRQRRHRQLDRQLGTSGNALFLAHQIGDLGFQGDLASGLCILGHLDRAQQPGLAFIAEVGQRSERQALGERPLDRSSAESFRQLPVDPCRQATVTGVAPVGMPVRIMVDVQGQPVAAARGQGMVFAEQFQRQMFGGQGVSPFVGTPDLQPETSINYELAGYYDSLEGFSANLTLFHNKFDDKIARADGIPNCYNIQGERHLDSGCADIGPGWAEFGYTEFSQTINVDEAVTMGAELGFKMVLADTWSLRGNYTYTDSEQKSGAGAGLPLVNTPEHMANATLDWQVAQQLRLSLVSEYRGKRFRYIANAAGPGEGDALSDYYKAYGLLHMGAHYQASESLSFNARINNLLDDNLSSRSCAINDELNGYSCTADYNTTEKARSFWLSASVTF